MSAKWRCSTGGRVRVLDWDTGRVLAYDGVAERETAG
jgi:hypothetical protein